MHHTNLQNGIFSPLILLELWHCANTSKPVITEKILKGSIYFNKKRKIWKEFINTQNLAMQ